MKSNNQTTFIRWRFYLLLAFILLVVLGLVARIVNLTVIKHAFLQGESNSRVVRTMNVPAFRGMIADRHGYPLAISTSVYSAWVNPQEFNSKIPVFSSLSELLNLPEKNLQALIKTEQRKKREFIYLKRNLSPEIAEKIKALKIPGIYLQPEYKRYYPEGEVTAHVLGFTNVDDQGQEGLELAYNEWLAGVSGKQLVIKDRIGRVISKLKTIQPQKPGSDLHISIDNRIQYVAYRELLAGVAKNFAKSGSIIVLDVKTGEILAMANYPSFNPNNRVAAQNDTFRNRAVTDVFEPGSTMKAFSIATALQSGIYKSESVIDTSPGWMRVGRNIVQDEHNNGLLTVAQILQLSSNVGVTKMILSLPENHLWNLLHQVGFGEVTGIGFPGERAGALVNRTEWKPFALATLSWGYGVSVTTLQLAEAYSVIANEGIKIPPSLLVIDKPSAGTRVMDAHTANEMLKLLETVVTEKKGTGARAHIAGYRIAGKTGTSFLAGPHGYEKNHYISSFVGIAPVSSPRLVVAIVIHEPHGKFHHGGDVSAPVFEKVMSNALRILNIQPDNIESLNQKEVVAQK